MDGCVLLSIILAGFSISEVISQSEVRGSLVPLSTNCSNLTLVHFLSYFPCVNVSSEEELKRCDIFAYVAATMAVERINRDPEVLSNAELKLASIYNLESSSSELSIDALFQVLDVFSEDQVLTSLWGIVGPLTTQQARTASVFSIENAGLMMVSYAARDPGLNNPADYQSTFYRSLPSDDIISKGRLLLLREFEWYRIGVINSQQPPYPQMVENFRKWHSIYSDRNDSYKIDVSVQESFTNFHNFNFLKILRKRDVRIILGFFGPDEARHIICMAKNYDLTTADHVWILPAYYNPDWWKSPPLIRNNDCSDEEMLDILNKLVIFIDGVKYPSIDLSMSELNSQLINKTRRLLPSLSDVDLSRYLQHSRATSAYDAVILLARSLDLVVDRGDDLCHDPVRVQTALERCLIDCEQCRLFSGCSSSQTFANVDCRMCEMKGSCDLNHTFDDLRQPKALNSYGQVLISQFIDWTDCPISIFWDTDMEQAQLINISNLADHPCAGRRLGLDRNKTFLGIERCPIDFQWKSGSPPLSNHAQYSFIPLAEFAPVATLTVIGLLGGVCLMVFTIIWRNNRHVKVSSPRLNIVFIFGFFLVLPSTAIYDALILSAVVYNIPEWFRTPICQLQIWTGFIGSGLMLATLIVKNWRIYRIFHNKKLQKKKEQLSDNALLVGILILIVPLLLILIGWNAQATYVYFEWTLENDFQVITVTNCGSLYSGIWAECVSAYLGVMLIALFLLSIVSIRVPTQFSHEGQTAQRVILINLVVIPILSIADLILELNPYQWHKAWWVGVSWSLTFPICLLGALFVPQVYSVIADHYREKKKEYHRKYSKSVSDQYANLVQEALNLKKYLKQMDEELIELKLTPSKAKTTSLDTPAPLGIHDTKH